MSALGRIRGARATLVTTLTFTALLKAVAAALGVLCLAGIVDLATPLPLGARRVAVPVAIFTGLGTLLILLFRGRHAFNLERVALYLEERVPALEYALVTALGSTGANAPALDRAVERAAPGGALRAPVARGLGVSAGMLALAVTAVAALPAAQRERILRPKAGDLLLTGAPGGPLGSRLIAIAVRFAPPAYARQRTVELDNPASVSALAGSRVEIRGRGAERGGMDSLGASTGGSSIPVRAVADTWMVLLPMPQTPAAIRLSDRSHARLLTLEPTADLPPAVSLTAPSRDTSYAHPRGRLTLSGSARDDYGLARAEFELMHTSGSGERFDIRRLTLGTVEPRGARTAAIQATLLLDTMKLGPGDVLHVRVTARDENTVFGPGEGASDTRTIRIADPRARDTVQVIAAAVAELDTTMLSQRMLVIRAESLQVRRRRITEPAYRGRSDLLGKQQGQLRERVEAVIEELTTATDAGFTGPTESSLVLSEAVAAMKLAQRELGVFRVSDALPHMYRALKALERVRSADRLYLRGIFPKLVVDLEKIRLKGTDKPSVGGREARPPLPSPRKILRQRLDGSVALLQRGAGGIGDSLVLIRVDALTQAPDAAASLAQAIDALRAGKDPMPGVRAARRLLLRATVAVPGVAVWRGAP